MRNSPRVMLDLNESSKYGGPYRVAHRIAASDLNRKYDFCFLRYGGDNRKALSLFRVKQIYRQICECRPDILHVSGLQVYGFLIVLLGRIAGCDKIIVTIRGTSWDAKFLPFYKKIIVALFLEPFTLLLCTRFYCNSAYTQNRKISQLFSFKRIDYIYNYWRDAEVTSNNQAEILRDELKIMADDFVILLVGRVTLDKGFAVFCDVARRFREKRNIKFLVVGSGDYLAQVRQQLSQQIEVRQVICVGHKDEVTPYLQAADVYLNPSLHETLSISTLEAMSQKLPCLVSDTGGLKEVVSHGLSGIRFPVGDVERISREIEDLQINKNLRDTLGRNGFERVNSVFDEDLITRRIGEVYHRVGA